MSPVKQNLSCFCGHACVYYLIRCDACHRGVHFACIGLTLAKAAAMTTYVCRTCQDTRLGAEGRPGAVVFTATCRQHDPVTGQRSGTSSTTPTFVQRDEKLSPARCDVCDHRCNFELIQCDNCTAWCHYACVNMTSQLAERIEKWYCRPCRRNHPKLKITYIHDSMLVPAEQPTKHRQGVRQSKRKIGAEENGRLEKKARLCDSVQYAVDHRPADEPELELDLEEDVELELDLGDDQLELDLTDEPEPWANLEVKEELKLDLEDEPEMNLEFDEVESEVDEMKPVLEDKDELTLDLEEDDPELELDLVGETLTWI